MKLYTFALLASLGLVTACGGGGDDDHDHDHDAEVPDAEVPDAEVPDAAPPDARACATCGEIVTGDEREVCAGTSEDLFNALQQCVCVDVCADVCGANVCSGGSPDVPCGQCLQDTSAGCGNQLNACGNDI
jgi:hypothetical protein